MHVGINRTYRDDSSESGSSPSQEFSAAESGGRLRAEKRAAEDSQRWWSSRPALATCSTDLLRMETLDLTVETEMRTKDFHHSMDT